MGASAYSARRIARPVASASNSSGRRQRVVDRVGVAGRERLLDEMVDREAVLGVHHHEAAGLLAALEHGQEEIVGHHQHVRVGEEDLERRHARVDHRLHVLERAGVGLRDRHVEAVVDVGRPLGAAHPLLERRAQPAGLHLQCEVDEAGRAAGGRGLRAGVVVVRGRRPAERHREVRVVVDRARHDEAAGRVEHLGVDAGEVPDARDLLAIDEHVGDDGVDGGHDRAAADDLLHDASREGGDCAPMISARRSGGGCLT